MARKGTRSAQGGGTIRQRPDGRWEARYTARTQGRTIYGTQMSSPRQNFF